MPVGIYEDGSPNSLLSENGELTNPLIFKVGNDGATLEQQLFLRHTSLSGEGAESSADVSIRGLDLSTASDDVDSWVQIAQDSSGAPGTYGSGGAPVVIGNVNLGEALPFWVKVTVPANSEVGAREDLALNLTSSSSNTFTGPISLPACEYYGSAAYLGDEIKFYNLAPGGGGDVYTHWIDISDVSAVGELQYNISSGTVYVYYRTAEDDTGTNATLWYTDPADLDISGSFDYLQIWIQLVVEGVGYTTISGLERRIYNTHSFSEEFLIDTKTGQRPFTATPGDGLISTTFSVKWSGYFYAPIDGTYAFRIDSDDGHQLFINGATVLNNLSSGSKSASANIALTVGWHFIDYRHREYSGGEYMYGYVTEPGGSLRQVALSDFETRVSGEEYIVLSDIEYNYTGPQDSNFDIRFYIGPATPELIAPADGSSTELFNPLLSAVSVQADFIQFQLDSSPTFSTADLQTWEVAASDDVVVETQSPVFDRDPGVWYWRARAKHEGNYGTWSDYRTIIILPFVGQDQYLYINVNQGLQITENNPEYYYLNVNQGQLEKDIYNKPCYYINVNVGTGLGEVIYPLTDQTPVRKLTFDGDEDFFQ